MSEIVPALILGVQLELSEVSPKLRKRRSAMISCRIGMLIAGFLLSLTLLVPQSSAGQGPDERIELTCTGSSGSQVAEKIKSYELGRQANLGQRLQCNSALSALISSGMDLVSLSTDGSKRVYSFVSEGAKLAIGPRPPVEPSINCNPSTNPTTGGWTCKCTGSHVLYCEIFCTNVTENYYGCTQDESTNDRIVRYINSLSGK